MIKVVIWKYSVLISVAQVYFLEFVKKEWLQTTNYVQ